MPCYSYFCETNQKLVLVEHPMDTVLRTWGEVCYVKQLPVEGDPSAPVKKIITPPNISITPSNAELKSLGFTKLVKRDEGVYENLTALDHEERYMVSGNAESIPDLKSKISD